MHFSSPIADACHLPWSPSKKVRNRWQHVLLGNTDSCAHEGLLAQLSPEHRAVAVDLLHQALQPPNPSFCLARVYRGASQCRRRPCPNSDFCKAHASADVRGKHGLQGNLLPLKDLHSRVKAFFARPKLSYIPGFKWYSRYHMWRFAENLGSDGVISLSDEDYVQGLRSVHDTLSRSPALRLNLQLEPHQGPQSLSDRHTALEDYDGQLCIFEYYDRAIFVAQLGTLRVDASPDSATKREFMDSLFLASQRMRNWFFLRNFPDCKYRGPQSYTHRLDLGRLNFTVTSLSDVGTAGDESNSIPAAKSRAPSLLRPFLTLSCDLCHRRRRVDADTARLFCSLLWENEALREACLQLSSLLPHLNSYLDDCKTSDSEIDLHHVEPFLAGCTTPLLRCALLHLIVGPHLERFHRASDALRQLYDNVLLALPRPSFKCITLVDTSCADADDMSSVPAPVPTFLQEPSAFFMTSHCLFSRPIDFGTCPMQPSSYLYKQKLHPLLLAPSAVCRAVMHTFHFTHRQSLGVQNLRLCVISIGKGF